MPQHQLCRSHGPGTCTYQVARLEILHQCGSIPTAAYGYHADSQGRNDGATVVDHAYQTHKASKKMDGCPKAPCNHPEVDRIWGAKEYEYIMSSFKDHILSTPGCCSSIVPTWAWKGLTYHHFRVYTRTTHLFSAFGFGNGAKSENVVKNKTYWHAAWMPRGNIMSLPKLLDTFQSVMPMPRSCRSALERHIQNTPKSSAAPGTLETKNSGGLLYQVSEL